MSSNCRHHAQPFRLVAKLQDSVCYCSKSWRTALSRHLMVSLVNAKIVLSRCDDAFLALDASKEFPLLTKGLPSSFVLNNPPSCYHRRLLRTPAAQPDQDVRSFTALHPCALGSLVCWLLRKGLLPEFRMLHISDLSSSAADLGTVVQRKKTVALNSDNDRVGSLEILLLARYMNLRDPGTILEARDPSVSAVTVTKNDINPLSSKLQHCLFIWLTGRVGGQAEGSGS
ncbi:hypothetical protein C8J56DRAFT_1039146 [Mycena floridula]|nr:hypothetical protein C8J56DRAFT_1039146 [Mycena floridula]